jgi:hypothetical protein
VNGVKEKKLSYQLFNQRILIKLLYCCYADLTFCPFLQCLVGLGPSLAFDQASSLSSNLHLSRDETCLLLYNMCEKV